MSLLVLKLVGTPDGPTIRGKEHEGCGYYSAYDFMTKMCKYQDNGNSARKEFSRIIKEGSEYQQEVAAMCRYLKFPGSGQKETPCMTIRGLQRLLMILGGKVAAEFREIVEGTFTRVMAGDQSLIEVINANAASQDPVQKAYRAGLAQEPVDPALDDFCLKRKREREDLLFDMEMAERKLRLEECQLRIDDGKLALDERKVTLDERKVTLDERKVTLDERKLHHETKMIEHINTSMGSINALKDWANVDERTKLQAEDHIKNLLFNKLAAAPVDPSSSSMDGPTITLPNTPLSIGNVAHELGYKLSGEDLRRVGVAVKKRYDQQDNTEPLSKHLEICGGRPTYVNSYSEKYRSLIAEVIHADQEKALKSKRCKPLETYFKSS